MDVFELTAQSRAFFAAAAFRAAEELGLYRALPCDPAELPARLGVAPRRLRPLVDALRLEGLLTPHAQAPPAPVAPNEGWGRLAEVIRADRPLDAAAYLSGFHAHLAEAGAAAARELAARLVDWAQPPTLLDLGGGLGTYARAFVERGGRALVVDRAEVVAQTRPVEGVEFVSGDLFEVARRDFGVVLLCNVLHLYGADDCARLCARASECGHLVVVKDLDRRAPSGIWFALNMALYTEAGDVHDAAQIADWLGGGEVESLGEHIVVRGKRR